jgi:ABC-2 type transport system permease protein
MIRALLYLRLTSLKNQVLTRTLRLRQPKYLAGALAAVAYFYYFVFRRFGALTPAARPHLGLTGFPSSPLPSSPVPPFDPLLIGSSVGMLLMMIGWVAFAWAFPANQPALRFTPAEIGFLFPAPITRRRLIHFSLLSSQFKILFSAILFGLIWSRREFSGEGALLRIAGWWVMLSAADLHKAGANLTFAQMKDRGWDPARGRMLALGLLGLFFGLVAFSLWNHGRWPGMAEMGTGPAFAGYIAGQLDAGWLHWLLAPVRLAAGPFLAPTGRAFLIALGPALLLVAAHYFWVMSLETSFEEGSIAQAEKRAQMLAARAAGGSPFASVTVKARREPFLLRPSGRPETAFLWKNLLSIGAAINWRLLRIALPILFPVILFLTTFGGHRGHARSDTGPILVLVVSGMVAFYTLLVGPQLVRQDLRSDLPNIDLLKTYPLAGWQVVLGEMLAPIAILSGLLWIALAAAAWALGAFSGQVEWLTAGNRLTFVLCLACIVPLLCALELIVPNAAMLVLPGWHQTTRTPGGGGIEMMGQRLIFVFGQVLVVLLMLLPAVVAAALLIFATQWIAGLPAAAVLATLAVLVILGGEAWCWIWWLGRRFEKLDLSMELKNA